MISLPLTAAEKTAFEDALRSTVRVPRFQAQLYSKTGDPLPITFDVLGGEVRIDATSPRQTVTRAAYLTIANDDGRYSVDWNDPSNRSLWFNKQVRITYGLYVASLSKWIDVPIFQGPIYTANSEGSVVHLDCQGKEALHLPPAYFSKSSWVRKHTKKHTVIKTILQDRGETEFDLEPTNKRLHRDRIFTIGGIPWKTCVNIADGIDRQLFYDGLGRVRLRQWPESPAWNFTEDGDTAMIVGDPQESVTRDGVINMVIVRGEKTFKREVVAKTTLKNAVSAGDNSFTVTSNATKFITGAKVTIGGRGGTPDSKRVASRVGSVVTITGTMNKNHAKSAPVEVRIKEDATKTITGKASLDRNHLLSEGFLGTAFIRILDRPSVNSQAEANNKADAILNRIRNGLGDDIEFSFLPVPHLEEGDKVRVAVLGRTIRIKSMTIPLSIDGLMTINHQSRAKVGNRNTPRKPPKGKATVNRIYTQTDGSLTRNALTTSWTDGASLPVEQVTDFEPTEGIAVIDPDGTPETIYFTGVNLDTENLTGVVRPNAAAHAAGVFVQAGSSPTTRKFAAGYFDTDPSAEVRGIPIRAAVEPWHSEGFKDAGTEYVVEIEMDEDDEGQPWIISAPVDNPDKTFDGDLNVLPPVGGGDSSSATTDPNSGKVLPPKGMGFEDGSVPTGTVVTEAFGGIGNTIWVTWNTLANSTQVAYEVHVSTTTGFTPADGTLYAVRSLAGEGDLILSQQITDFPASHDLDGTASDPPQPGTDYFIKIRPRDGSGYGTTSAQVSATPLETIADGSITVTQIADNAISTPKLAANAVTAAKIAANTITASQIAAGTITAAQIAANTITAAKIAAGTITTTELNAGAINGMSISGVTLTGGTVQTATSGTRVVMSSTHIDTIRFYNSGGTIVGLLQGATGGLDIGGNGALSLSPTGKVSIGTDANIGNIFSAIGFYNVTPVTRQARNNLSGSDSTTAQLHSKLNGLLDDLRNLGLIS